MTDTIPADRHRALPLAGRARRPFRRAGRLHKYHRGWSTTASVPDDYRLRHPIAIQEADRSVVIFVGHARGGLSASQRADVHGTGADLASRRHRRDRRRCAGRHAERAGRRRLHSGKSRSLLAAAGVPSRGITVHHYHPDDPAPLATIRLSYPKIAAVAGPCGLWPEDLGPSI